MPKRRTFFSFHYELDAWRAAQVRNMGLVEGNAPVSDNDWESVTRGGEGAIKRWIARQMRGRSCTIVLVGAKTANRKWINYEIKKSWNDGKGLVGIYVHGLKNQDGRIARKGRNPFGDIHVGSLKLSSIVKCYNPQALNSTDCYAWIERYLDSIVEEAITIRSKYL